MTAVSKIQHIPVDAGNQVQSVESDGTLRSLVNGSLPVLGISGMPGSCVVRHCNLGLPACSPMTKILVTVQSFNAAESVSFVLLDGVVSVNM